jgi:hypothetical protein
MTDVMDLATARQLFTRYGEAGWLLTDPQQLRASNAGPVIYLCDVPSGRTLLLATQLGALQSLDEQADVDEASHQQICAALVVLIGDLFADSAGIHADTRRGVILGAAICCCVTCRWSAGNTC